MTPLERPVCCLCDEPAVVCECPNLLSGQEVIIPLVYKFEPSTCQEGLELFATYVERHPATSCISVRDFISDYAKDMQAVEQVANMHMQVKEGHPNLEQTKTLAVIAGQRRTPAFGLALCQKRLSTHGN